MTKNIRGKLSSITNLKYFDECFVLIIAIITIFGWEYNSTIGMISLIIISIFILIVFNDLLYVVPIGIFFIFTMKDGFSNNEIPIKLIVIGSIFAIILLFYAFKNGIKYKKMKSLWGLIGLAIMNLIPIFWCNTIENGYEVFYFFFFADLGYLVLYLIFVNGIKKSSLKFVSISMSYLALILSIECAIRVFELKDTVENIFELWYYLGWGLCNEAGIMICVSIPFIFYLIASENEIKIIFLQLLKLVISIIGVLLTTSRGSYLACFVIVFLSVIILFFNSNRKRFIRYFILSILIVIIPILVIFSDYFLPLLNEAIDKVFYNGLDDNGRVEIWTKGINLFKQNNLYTLFGSGICSIIEKHNSAVGVQLVPLVFHSTIVQTLVMGGIFGILMLILHFYEKYRNLCKTNLKFFLFIGVGYLVVDLYGMIDNTYHMYYFMIPLVIILASIDSYNFNKASNSI